MKKVFAVACFAGLAGCDMVFGLEGFEHVPDAGATSRVRGRLWERYVTNDSNFMPLVVERTYPPTALAAAVTLEDGSEAPLTYNEDGSFEFGRAREDQLYRFVYTVEDQRNEMQLTVPELAIPRIVAGRPSRAPQTVSYLQFPYPAAVADLSGAYVASTGIYTLTYTGAYGPTVTFDWRTAGPTGNARLGMLDARENDRAYVLEYRIDRTTHAPLVYNTLSAASSAAITQVTGQTHQLPAPAAAARNGCVNMDARIATGLARIRSAGRSYVYLAGDWHVFGVPAPQQMAASGAVFLAAASQATALDSTISATFHNPFPGWSTIAQAGALAGFDVQLPGTTTGARFYDATRRYKSFDPDASCAQPPVDMLSTLAIPGDIALAGIPLATDAQVVSLPGEGLELTWKTVVEGEVEFMSVTVHELIPAGTFTTSVARRTLTTIGHRAILDRALFVPGNAYIIGVSFHTGRPNAVDGDWSVVADPLQFATVWSHYFTVE